MKKLILLVLLLCLRDYSFGCSACAITKGRQLVFAKNLDWAWNTGMLVVNKRNVQKKAFLPAAKKPAAWTSKYGSITFNPNGEGAPCGGMNEVGLVVEESALVPTKYPEADQRPSIDEIQWIQYQLDNCKTVDEVMATDKTIRIESYYWVSHYMVYDRKGDALAVDAVNGKMVFNKIGRKGVQVLTNNTYEESLQKLKSKRGFGGADSIVRSKKSLDRFCVAADMIRSYQQDDKNVPIVDYAFSMLSTIAQKTLEWSTVYDVRNLVLHYRTASSPEIKYIRFKDVDFDCKTPVKYVDLHIKKAGNLAADFTELKSDVNREMVDRAVADWRKQNVGIKITDEEIEKLKAYPTTMTCGDR